MTIRNEIQNEVKSEWVVNVEKRASEIDAHFASLERMIRDMPTVMLHYLIHYNNGGPSYSPLVTLYEDEAKRRGKPYTAEIGEMIEEILSL